MGTKPNTIQVSLGFSDFRYVALYKVNELQYICEYIYNDQEGEEDFFLCLDISDPNFIMGSM